MKSELQGNFWSTVSGVGPVPVTPKVDFPALDHAVIDHWEKHNVFQRSISERPFGDKGDFVAYDGPPGTNGKPHIGHMMQSALKDLWPRYKTMQGYRVLRKAGWDTHGLPIELTAERELGFGSKRDIEAYGVEKYIDYCRSTVFRYRDEWIKAIKRIGRFLDTDDDYATFRKEYIETDWWVLKQAWDKGLLYQDRRIMPYCSRCGTSLSQHEVAQGYKDVQDISIYAKFPVVGQENTFFVAWTTTPWTLLSNVALAVNPEMRYVKVEVVSGERLILAEARLEAVKAMLGGHNTLNHYTGSDLEGMFYTPLWDFQSGKEDTLHVVIADNYVTADDGTGIVHLALYGADDFRLIRANNLPMVQKVDLDGKCTPDTGAYAGRWFREEGLDVDILKDLAARGLLFGKEKITHSYPHCYRCDTPLMYFAMSGWFLRTSAFKEQMLAANKEINWFPDHIKEGRFGNWLENNVDWNISRDRYWGSPLPIWTCGGCGHQICIGSFKELMDLEGGINPALQGDFDPHKPGIDKIELPCEKCGARMKRTPEVLDSWFNAGIMPWGQWGYPAKAGSRELFESQFPGDFICEAIDQTRGWFYTMLATSVLLTTRVSGGDEPDNARAGRKSTNLVSRNSDPGGDSVEQTGLETRTTRFSGGQASFKNVICTELVNDAEGKKMSKSRGNVVDPMALCEKYGADAVRWTFYSVNPWTARKFSEADLGEVLKQVLIPYWNCYSFFTTYARVDGWKPDAQRLSVSLDKTNDRPAPFPSHPNPLDRWILSRLVWLDQTVRGSLDNYDVTGAAQAFTTYLDDLTNWHIRRSRRRFWKSDDDDDKRWAYQVLHHVLVSLNRMLAPFMPFVSEAVYQNIERGFDPNLPDSVHLASWPQIDPLMRDEIMEKRMDLVRKVVTLAHSIRADNKARVRQPLREIVIPGMPDDYMEDFKDLILDELNVKTLRRIEDPSEIMTWKAKGDFKSLGPKFGAKAREVASAIESLDHHSLSKFASIGSMELDGVKLEKEDIILSLVPAEGYWIRADGGTSVGISSVIDAELTSEWLAREFIHTIQNMRRDAGLEVTDRIAIEFCGDRDLRDALVHHIRYIAGETLAESMITTLESDAAEVRVGDRNCRIRIRPFK